MKRLFKEVKIIGVRIETEDYLKLQALAEDIHEKFGDHMTVSDVVRGLIHEALKAHEEGRL
jgi:hypothetical protein